MAQTTRDEPRLPRIAVKELLKDGHDLKLASDALLEARLWVDDYLQVLGAIAAKYARLRGAKIVQREDLVAAKDYLNANGFGARP